MGYIVVIRRIAWDDDTVAHISKHGVTPEQVEEVLSGMPIQFSAVNRNGEARESFIGPTRAGRLMFVVVTEHGATLRVVTVYPADRIKARWYRENLKRMP